MTQEHNDYYKNTLVKSLHDAIQRGAMAMEKIPELLLECIYEGLWRDHMNQWEAIHYKSNEFNKFIEAPYPEGLSTTVDVVLKLCVDNMEALEALTVYGVRPKRIEINPDDTKATAYILRTFMDEEMLEKLIEILKQERE